MKVAKNYYQKLPESPGVYIFKDDKNRIIYIGKAGNLRRRVSSYFQKSHDSRIEQLIGEIKKIEYKKTDSALEALILEAKLIKEYEPAYNIKEKDDKSFLCVEITREKFPRVLLTRAKDEKNGIRFGPFTSASSVREALRILRKIFHWNMHTDEIILKSKRPCFDYQIGLCPGACIHAIERKEYLKTIQHVKLFFQGKKKKIIGELKTEMKKASKTLDFERAGKIKRQIFALQHIQDVAILSEGNYQFPITNYQTAKRIECYDISDISGTSAVGGMVIFENGRFNKNEYRKFKIRAFSKPDDIGMLKEVLERRFSHKEWRLPDTILIDGGKGQVGAAEEIITKFGLKIPVIGIAKGKDRKKNELHGSIPKWVDISTLIKIRDATHKFAISYHRKLRQYQSIND